MQCGTPGLDSGGSDWLRARSHAQPGIQGPLALTDSSSSPLARIARYSFYVPNQSLFFSNSMCAFMLLAEGILSGVASRLGEASVAALKHRDALIIELNVSL